jgi:hypothetical protein
MSSPQYAAPAMGGPEVQKLSWSLVLHRTYTLYGRNFWTYFQIALLPMALAYLFSYASRQIYRQFWSNHQLTEYLTGYLVISLYGWIKGAAYWILSAFFCAAVAATFNRDQTSGLAVSDAYTLPRHKVGAVAAIALLAWTVFFVGRSSLNLALVYLMTHLRVSNLWIETGVIDGFLLALAGLVARWGLAIPALMHDPKISIREALRTSVQRTENWEAFFMLFLAKTGVSAYLGYWLVREVMHWTWQHTSVSATAYVWIEWALYICLAAALESPLFIAFSILYRDSSLSRVEAFSPAAIE